MAEESAPPSTPVLTVRTCATCRHWGHRAEQWNAVALRTCGAPAIVHAYKVIDVHEDPRQDLAVVEVWEGWGLLTGPEFGCVHWQAGESPTRRPEDTPAPDMSTIIPDVIALPDAAIISWDPNSDEQEQKDDGASPP